MKSVFQALFAVFILVFTIYVLKPYDRCDRVERSTSPIRWGQIATDVMIRPWVEPETRYDFLSGWVRFRLATNKYVRTQFFIEEGEKEFKCGFDGFKVPTFADTAVGKAVLKGRPVEDKDESGSCIFFNCPESAGPKDLEEPVYKGEN
jgi:hypothetical protein